MAEPQSTATPSSSSSSYPAVDRDASGPTTSSSSSSQVRQVENESNGPQFQSPEPETHNMTVHGGMNWAFDDASSIVREDTWSCVIVLLTFWFFVSITMILGVYGSMNLLIGPNSSILIQPNPIFVQSIKVENLYESDPGTMLYGIYGSPPLDNFTTWEETRNVSIPSDSHKEWRYYLNRGSQVNISYRLSSESSSIFLVVAEGNEGLTQWLEDPTYPDTTLSWNIIHGTGMISQDIYSSSSYYVAVGNLNEEVEVELQIGVRASLYNTTNAYYKCALTSNPCSLNIFFPDGNAAVLTSPGPQQNKSSDEWYIKLSYGPRWITYIFGIGGMTLLMFLAFNFLNKLQCAREDRVRVEYVETASQRAPLLTYKDDSSLGSSYDSMSHDEEDLDFLTGVSIDGKSLADGETNNNTQRLCAICFDAPRDCFFLPCGHCVACFPCGTRLAEAAGTCPVCRRNMKKVRKIFSV